MLEYMREAVRDCITIGLYLCGIVPYWSINTEIINHTMMCTYNEVNYMSYLSAFIHTLMEMRSRYFVFQTCSRFLCL